MNKLPLLLSVPHAGLRIPPEVATHCVLTPEQVINDGDEGAAAIYDLQECVAAYITTDVARAVVDLNRAVDDRRADGVIKTHTCWNEVVYRQPLTDEVIEELLRRYYHPYHQRLGSLVSDGILLSVDCHTMAQRGPPIGPGAGKPRPHVCLGDDHGKTLPRGWMEHLADCFRAFFSASVAVNEPFSGGYITRHHGQQRPWVQLEISRGDFMSPDEKRAGVLAALSRFASRHLADA